MVQLAAMGIRLDAALLMIPNSIILTKRRLPSALLVMLMITYPTGIFAQIARAGEASPLSGPMPLDTEAKSLPPAPPVFVDDMTLARKAEAARDPAEALARYLRVLAPNPANLEALMGAGRAALDIGDANAAINFFARAEQIAPRNGQVKAGLGSSMVQLVQPKAALKLFQDAVEYGVPVTEIAADRGLAYDLRGENKRARADYELALASHPESETTRLLALSIAMSGDPAGALLVLDALLRKQDKAAWRDRAFIMAITGDVKGAENTARAVLPRPQALAIEPFLARIAKLKPAQQAAAVHFGQFPSDGRQYSEAEMFAAAGLDTPAVPIPTTTRSSPKSNTTTDLADNEGDGIGLEKPLVARPMKASSEKTKPTARSVSAGAKSTITNTATLPPPSSPPALALTTEGPRSAPLKTIIADGVTGPLNYRIDSRVTHPEPTPTPTAPSPAPSPISPGASTAPLTTAKVDPAFQLPPKKTSPEKEAAPKIAAVNLKAEKMAAEKKAAEKALAAKALAAKDKAVTDKAAKDKLAVKEKVAAKTKAAASAKEPSRYWVQVATGAYKPDLGKAWGNLKAKYPAQLGGRTPWTTPLNRTNRLLIGPFKSNADAQAFVNKSAGSGFMTSPFTSAAGQTIERVAN